MTRKIDTDAVIGKIRLQHQSSHPSAPASGYGYLYLTTGSVGGGLVVEDPGGNKYTFITGSAGITQSYLGYNSIGASTEAMTANRIYAKKIAVPSNGILTSIGVYCALNDEGIVTDMSSVLFSDNAGTPEKILSYQYSPYESILLDSVNGAGGLLPRWLEFPCGLYLTAGDYWIGVASFINKMNIYYDGSGSDRYYTSGNRWVADWGFYSPSTSSNNYSIRASFIK